VWLPQQRAGFSPNDSEDENIALCMRGRDALALPEFKHWAGRIWTAIYGYTGRG